MHARRPAQGGGGANSGPTWAGEVRARGPGAGRAQATPLSARRGTYPRTPRAQADSRRSGREKPPGRGGRRPTRAEASSLWSRNTSSFFDDQRAEQVGDILTVVINIDDDASLKNASERSRSGTQDVNSPSFFGYGSQIDKILPGVSASDLPTGGNIVDLGNTSASAGEGSIKRNEAINLRVAALIIKELPNGNFVIAGRQ